jgi:hypothetical protein
MSARRTAVEAVRIAGSANEVRACAGTYGDEDEDEERGRGNGGPAIRCCRFVATSSLTRGVRGGNARDAVMRAHRIDRVRDGLLVLLFVRGRCRCGQCDYWGAWNGGGRGV